MVVWRDLFFLFKCSSLLLLNLQIPEMGGMLKSNCVTLVVIIFLHTTIAGFGLEGTLKATGSSPCRGQGHLPLSRVAQSPIQRGLGFSSTGASLH